MRNPRLGEREQLANATQPVSGGAEIQTHNHLPEPHIHLPEPHILSHQTREEGSGCRGWSLGLGSDLSLALDRD